MKCVRKKKKFQEVCKVEREGENESEGESRLRCLQRMAGQYKPGGGGGMVEAASDLAPRYLLKWNGVIDFFCWIVTSPGASSTLSFSYAPSNQRAVGGDVKPLFTSE